MRTETMLPLEEALRIALEAAAPLPVSDRPLEEAYGLTLAEDLTADRDIPPIDRSAMDGYAVRIDDLSPLPRALQVVETIAAGEEPSRAVRAGECAKIMTGAPVPTGADTVVIIEDTDPDPSRKRVSVRAAPRRGANLRRRGEDHRKGGVALPRGTRIRPAGIALAAALGKRTLSVIRRPSAAVLATGEEVVDPSRTPRSHQVRNCNTPALAARLRGLGITIVDLGIAGDRPDILKEKIRAGLAHDIFMISGGVSMGDFDLVPGILREEGVAILFEKVAVKPGKPTLCGLREACMVFGLPGNPVSVLVTAELFAVTAIKKRMGDPDPHPRVLSAVTDGEVRQKPDRRGYYPARLRRESEGWIASPILSHGPADIAAAAKADGYLIVPQGTDRLPSGSPAEVMLPE